MPDPKSRRSTSPVDALTGGEADRIEAVARELSDLISLSYELTVEQAIGRLHRIDDELLLPVLADIATRAEGVTA